MNDDRDKCPLCGGTGILHLPPERAGYVHVHGRVWRMPDGRHREFSPHQDMEVAVPCGQCLQRRSVAKQQRAEP